jgi:hypothetical protein
MTFCKVGPFFIFILTGLQETIHGLSKRKRLKTCVYEDLDQVMLKWVTTAREKNLPLTGTIIREYAQEFADALGHQDFLASVGWLDKFKKRHNIVGKTICGESAAVDMDICNDWQKNILPALCWSLAILPFGVAMCCIT